MLIAGGGTGGHLFPGLALAEEVKTRHPRNDVLFVGTQRGLEMRVVPKSGFPLETIDVGPLKRQGGLGLLRGLGRVPRSLWQSRRILRRFDPDVVVGVGGYASGPVVLAAYLMGIPTAVQEQNALAGFTNRTLGRFAKAIFIAFDEARAGFPRARTHLLGNPIRRAFLDNYLHTKVPGDRLSILVTGGSQGAHALNVRVAEAIELLAPQMGSKLRVFHQTGTKDVEEISKRYQALESTGLQAQAAAFIDDMATAYAGADLLVCRAGATTLAEVTVAGKASILVPFPQAADDHQRKNAEALAQAGAAEMILQKDLNGSTLAARIRYYVEHPEVLGRMEQNSRALGRADATDRIVDLVEELSGLRQPRLAV